MGNPGDKLTNDAATNAENLQSRLTAFGDIRIRKMFGGYGIFREAVMFALVDSTGTIFFKADDLNLERYESSGSAKHSRMPYYQVPDSVFTDDAALNEWAFVSIQVAVRSKS